MVGKSVSWTIGRRSTFGLKCDGSVSASRTSAAAVTWRVANHEVLALTADRAAYAVQVEQREAVRLRHHLRFVAAVMELLAGGEGER